MKQFYFNTFLILVIFFTSISYSQTFDFSDASTIDNTSGSNPKTVVETLSGITATVRITSSNASNPDKTAYFDTTSLNGQLGATNGAVYQITSSETGNMIISFNTPVDIINLTVGSTHNSESRTWTFTPTGGTNSPVTKTSNFSGNASNVVLNWTSVTEVTISSNYTVHEQFILDKITLGAPCTAPDTPTVTYSPSTVCNGDNATLNITGNLNDATHWSIYTESCGGTPLGTTAGSSFTVTPTVPNTTYYIRGEGGCVTPSNCSTVTVNVTPVENASFAFGSNTYCASASDPSPIISGTTGGTFSSTAGLIIDPSTGVVDLSSSTPGNYTITYTTNGSCPDSDTFDITINNVEDASFSYSSSSFCINGSDPTPTITGIANGTFSSSPGLSINANTGMIDLSTSTPNSYIVSYKTNGACSNTANVIVTINALDNASFNYDSASYCLNDCNPKPTITGLGSGLFSSSPSGLSIDANTGEIDLTSSTPNNYTITYTTNGSCSNTTNTVISINSLDDASFSYDNNSYSTDDSDPSPTITGLGGGTFSSTTGLIIDSITGTIDVSESTPSTYTVTYTTNGSCTNSSDVEITITDNTLNTPSVNFDDNAIIIYPNPSNGIFQYSYNGSALIKSIEIYNIQGKRILTQKDNKKNINISNTSNGIYFVKFTTDKGSVVKKISKN